MLETQTDKLVSLLKGAGIAAGGAVLVYALGAVPADNALYVALAGVLVNVIRKYAPDVARAAGLLGEKQS